MSDDELFAILSEIADEEIMVKNRASIIEVGRRIEQASRRAALEEAALIHDAEAAGQGFSPLSTASAHRRYAAKIRALAASDSK